MSCTKESPTAATIFASRYAPAAAPARVRRPADAALRALTLFAALGALTGCGLLSPHGSRGLFGRPAAGPQPGQPLAAVADEGPAGVLHREQAGHVVFSTQAIARDAASGAALIARVGLGDELYVRTFLTQSRGNAFRQLGVRCHDEDTRDGIEVEINGAPRNQWVMLNQAGGGARRTDWDARTTYTLDDRSISNYAPRFPDDRRQSRYLWVASVVPRLRDGDNTLVFHATASCSGVGSNGTRHVELASGTLTVRVEPGQRERYLARFAPVFPQESHPEAPALRAPIFEAVAREWHDDVPVRAVVTSTGWEVRRHPISGAAVSRRVSALVVVHQRTSPPSVCRAFSLGFSQQSLDGRSRYAPQMTLWTGDSSEIPCPPPAAPQRIARASGRSARR